MKNEQRAELLELREVIEDAACVGFQPTDDEWLRLQWCLNIEVDEATRQDCASYIPDLAERARDHIKNRPVTKDDLLDLANWALTPEGNPSSIRLTEARAIATRIIRQGTTPNNNQED